MKPTRQTAADILARLPYGGIVAFSLCSTWSLYHLFADHARHPTPLYWLPAVLVELVTAWAVAQIVRGVRELTRSRISKQDRRFYGLITGAFAAVAAPLLGASLWANTRELNNVLLGALFPVASIGCAVGAVLPDVVATFRQRRATERQEKETTRQRRERERQARERERQQRATARQGWESRWESLGNAGATVRYFAGNPEATARQAAESLGISRRTVSNHLTKAEEMGAISRDGHGSPVEILIEVPR